MKSTKNNQQNRTNEYDDLRLKDAPSFTKYMEKLVEGLSNKTRTLPKVDEKGHSECWFAEDLYADKDKATEEVAAELKKLRRYRGLVKQEISRCEKNLEQIRTDIGRLHLNEPKDKYADAERAQEFKYKEARQYQKRIVDVIPRAEKAIAEARAKKFPGRKPRKSFRPPHALNGGLTDLGGSGFSDPAPIRSLPTGWPLKNEIDNLISLGPLLKKDSKGSLLS